MSGSVFKGSVLTSLGHKEIARTSRFARRAKLRSLGIFRNLGRSSNKGSPERKSAVFRTTSHINLQREISEEEPWEAQQFQGIRTLEGN